MTPCPSPAAGAWVGGHDQLERGRVARVDPRPVQVDDPRFQGFTQGVEHGGRELGGLVEEQNAAVCERCRARRQGARSAPDQGGHRHRVVGRLEGRARDEGGARGYEPCHGMQGRRHERGVRVQVGKNRRQPRGQHGFARAGLADEEDVVSSGRSDLHRPHRLTLASHVSHVEDGGRFTAWFHGAHPQVAVERSLDGLSPAPGDEVGQVREGDHLDAVHEPCLPGARLRDDHPTHSP